MKILNYKGVDVNHDASSDKFYTNIIILKANNGRKDQCISGTGLQAVLDSIDKFLNTAGKKPVLPKAWLKGKYDSDAYEEVEVVLYNTISGVVHVRNKNGKVSTVLFDRHNYKREGTLYLKCKENDTLISTINKKNEAVKKIEKEVNCTSGKLLPLNLEHFEK